MPPHRWSTVGLLAFSLGLVGVACGDDPAPNVLAASDKPSSGASTQAAEVPTIVDRDLISGMSCDPEVVPEGEDRLLTSIETLTYSDITTGYLTSFEALSSLGAKYPGMADAATLVGQNATHARFELPGGKGAFLVGEVHWHSGPSTWLLMQQAICEEARAQYYVGS